MLHGAGGTGGLPPSPCLHPVCRHVPFFMLICPFLMLSPLFFLCSMAQVGRGVSLHLHVSILLSTRLFFYANLSFSYAVPLFFLCSMAQVGRGVSLHLHVSILLSTRSFFMLICPFLMLSPSLSYAPWRRWDGGSPSISISPSCLSTRFFFMLICPFLMLSPSFSYAPRRTWDGHPCTRPDLFWCYPLCGAGFFYAAFVPFLCSMGHFPSISMSLPPSPCLHPVVDMFVFLCPRVFLVCVRFLLLCHRCFFANLSFSCAVPSSSYAPRRGWDGGRGTLVQDPTFFGAILYAELAFVYAAPVLFLCSMGRFPSISMSLPPSPCLPSCCRHFFLGLRTLPFFMLLLSFLCSMGQGMGKGRAWGSLAGPGLVSWPLREPDPFFMLTLPPSLRFTALLRDGTTSSTTSSTTHQQQHQHQHQHQHKHQHQQQ